jgi:hypothetical protein
MTAFIYVANGGVRLDICKIGFSVNPKARLRGVVVPGSRMRAGLVQAWRVVAPRAAERAAHRSLLGKRMEGEKEWFYLPPDDALVHVEHLLHDGGYMWSRARALDKAKAAWRDPKRSGSEVAAEFGVSRQTLYQTFGPRGTPDATKRGRRR